MLAGVGLYAGAIAAEAPAWMQITEKQPLAFAEGAQARSSMLRVIKSSVRDNAKLGELHGGWFCGKAVGELAWNEKLVGAFQEALPGIYQAELQNAHYPVSVIPDTIFEQALDNNEALRQDLQVGGMIKDAKIDLCLSSGVEGAAYVKIFWQVFAPETQKVVYETTTEGLFRAKGSMLAPPDFLERAFASSVRNLMAEQGFHDLIATSKTMETKAPRWASILKLKGGRASSEPLTKNIDNLRTEVVTIVRDDGASGSGFFVSQDGYLLTNKHVVGGAKYVKVKLPSGMELVGEVVRVEGDRDVALVKAPVSRVQAIPLRAGDLKIGEDVYALGSPLGDQFNTTFTHGIMSAYRTLDEKRFLQSDVAILPGNSGGPLLDTKGQVIGITVMGLGAKGLAGMNFFIPIGEALEQLGVELN